MITTGVTGSPWRASITPWGAVEPWDGTAPLNWFVAADDRWHVPADEPTVRQQRIDGTPVTETRVRVPRGDVVQRIMSVPDSGGLTVVEFENESTLPVAIALDRRDVLTERPIADIPIEGIELPAGSFVLPLGHKATARIGLAHGAQATGPLPPVPAARQVANGWLTLTERASRLVLPAGGSSSAARLTALRADIALGVVPEADTDPAGCAIAIGELVRLGERPDAWMPDLVRAVELLGPDTSWSGDAALVAADRVLVAASEDRARRDLARIVERRRRSPRPESAPDGVALIPWVESQFAIAGALLPGGLPAGWLGQSIEVYGIPTGPSSTIAYALRWHGDRPAVLWEQSGGPVALSAPVLAPDWASAAPSGEALWPAPPNSPPAAPTSFS